MRKPLISALLLLLLPHANAACPKSKKEWQAVGPKLLVEAAASRHSDIPDFSGQLGKSAKGTALPFTEKKNDFVLVEAKLPKEAVSLSGVMKCDLESKRPVLLSLTWIKGDKSGILKLGR